MTPPPLPPPLGGKRMLCKKKVIFIQLLEPPTPPYCYCSVTKRSNSSIYIETPHNEMKRVLRSKIQIPRKYGSKFSHSLMVNTEGADPPYPLTVSLKRRLPKETTKK